jgi:oligoribonuclease (3'-5' exoribonuclease)
MGWVAKKRKNKFCNIARSDPKISSYFSYTVIRLASLIELTLIYQPTVIPGFNYKIVTVVP